MLIKSATALILVLILAASPAWSAPPPSSGRLILEPAQPSALIGEPFWVDIRAPGVASYDASARRSSAFDGSTRVLVDADELQVYDPFLARPTGIASNVWPARASVDRNGSLRIDLARYLRLDAPGTFTVRIYRPTGEITRKNLDDLRPPDDDPRWLTATVRVVQPDEAQAREVVEGLPRDRGDRTVPEDFYANLGHALYVPILEDLARASGGEDERALYGLAACPCPEATEALLRLRPELTRLRARGLVNEALLARMPRPVVLEVVDFRAAWAGRQAWFSRQAWERRFDYELMRQAHAALEAWDGAFWDPDAAWAAEVILRSGGSGDAAALAHALARSLAWRLPPRTVDQEGPPGALLEVLRRFPEVEAPPGLPRLVRMALALDRWQPGAAPPDDWEALLEDALATDDASLVRMAMARLPPTPTDRMVAQVLRHARDENLQAAALGAMQRAPDPRFEPAAREALMVGDRWPLQEAWRAAEALGVPASERMEMLLDRLEEAPVRSRYPSAQPADILQLVSAVHEGCRDSRWRLVEADELPVLRAAWRSFLDTHRAALDAGERFPIDGPDFGSHLVSRAFRCTLSDGGTWPPR